MNGVFGGSSAPANGQAGSNTAIAPQAQPQVGQPAQAQGQLSTQVQTGQQPIQAMNTTPIPGQPQIAGQSAQPGDPAQTQLILGKFKGREDVVQSMVHIGQKLGKQVDLDMVLSLSDEELIQEYVEAEKELGTTSDIDRTRQENQLLKQQLDAVMQYIQLQSQGQVPPPAQPGYSLQPQIPQQPYGYPPQQPQYGAYQPQIQPPAPYGYLQEQSMQYPQQPRDPYGRFMSPVQPLTPQVDPEKFWEEFNEKGPQALTPLIDSQVQAAISQFQPVLQEVHQLRSVVQQQQQERQLQQHFTNQINGLRQKYGPEFDQYRQAVAQVIEQKPFYVGIPNGLEMAFLEAKQAATIYQSPQPSYQQVNDQQYLQQVYQQQQAAKMAAQIPGSTGMYEMPKQPRYFNSQPRKGVFG